MDNSQQTFLLSFDGVSTAEANRYAEELGEILLDASTDVQIERQRDLPNTQDFGATLVLVLGAPAAVAIAKGIQKWLEKRNTASVTIKTAAGEIVLKNVTSKDATEIAAAFAKKQTAG